MSDKLREAERIEVIRTVHVRGKGADEDPVREVITYWSLEGDRLAEKDDWAHTPTNDAPPPLRAA